jgi:hypothetical protein
MISESWLDKGIFCHLLFFSIFGQRAGMQRGRSWFLVSCDTSIDFLLAPRNHSDMGIFHALEGGTWGHFDSDELERVLCLPHHIGEGMVRI